MTQDKKTRRRGAFSWFNRSIRTQFNLTTTLLAIVPVILVAGVLAWFSVARSSAALEADVFARLVTLRSDRIVAVEEYFQEVQKDINVLLNTVSALRQNAVEKFASVNQNKAGALQTYFGVVRVDTLDIASDPGVAGGMVLLTQGFADLGPTRARSQYLGKPLLEAATEVSTYTLAHRGQHLFFTNYIDLHGYEDVLLVDMDGNVVYSVQKSGVFGTNLTSGNYQDTSLAQLYVKLRQAPPRQFSIADLAPLDDGLAMFAGAPIYADNAPIGVLIYRLSFKPINAIVQQRVGLEPSTETYLTAREPDGRYTYRSDRVVKTGVIGDPRPPADYNTLAFEQAGEFYSLGSTGVYELAVYQPLNLPGLDWAIITTGNARENFAPQLVGRDEDFYTSYIDVYGFHDLFLIQPDGFIFYSVQEEADFETNILTGPYKDSNLAQLVAQVLRTRQYGIVDFAFYEPSGGEPAAFAAQPLVRDGRIELIVAVQLSGDDLEAVVANYTGLGDTGETLLAGPDLFARSSLRMVEGPWILTRKLDTVAIRSALQGDFNAGDVIIDYRGVPVFNAWGPIEIAGGDFRWALAAKIDQAEALRPVTELQNTILLGSVVLTVVVGLIAVSIGTVISGRLVNPILGLTRTATSIAEGQLDVIPEQMDREDELGVLSTAFGTMTERLRGSIESLELRGKELESRTGQLEANQRAIQVVFSAGGAFGVDELLNLVVNLIRDRFNLYHVQMYLLDEAQENAVLKQSTGFAGQQLLARKHAIPMERTSLVTSAIRDGQPVLVPDVLQDPNYLANPLLPDTRSELVVPLKVNDIIVGALDIQSREAGIFTEDAISLYETMVGQIGLMFQNAQLFTDISEKTESLTIFTTQLSTAAEIGRRVSTILDPEQLLNEVVELLRSRFGFYHAHIYLLDDEKQNLIVRAGSGEVGRVLKDRGHAIPLDREHSLVSRAARERAAQVVNDTALESDFLPNPLLPQTRSELAVPLVVGNQTLGVLDIQDDQPERFGQAERDTFATLAGQVATALDNARLFTQQQQIQAEVRSLARQNQLVLDSTAEGIFGVDQEGKTVFVNPAAIKMLGFAEDELIGGLHHDLIHHHRADGSEYPAHECNVYAAYRDGKTHASDDEIYWHKDGHSFPVAYTSTPIRDDAGNILGAVVTFRDITEELAAREATEKRARELQTVAEVGTAAAASLDPQELLLQVSELTKERFGLYHAHIYLYDADSHTLKLAAGAGEAGQQMVAQGWSINPDSETSLVARAFRSRAGVIANNVQAAPDFLPNPLLPNTASELAVPLLSGEKALGVLDVQSAYVGRFTEADVSIQTTLAGQIATALENARLFETQRQQTAILSNSRDFIAMTDMQANLIYLNLAGAQMLGYEKPEDFLGKQIADSHDAEGLRRVEEIGIPTAMQTGSWRSENALLRRDGTLLPVDQTIFIIYDEQGHPQYLATIMSDITDRKAAEERIREANERFSLAKESIELGVWDWDVVNNVLVWDEMMYKLYGIRKEDFGGAYEAWQSGLHPDDAADSAAALQAALEGKGEFDVEFRVVHPGGEIRYIKGNAIILRDEQGAPLRAVGLNYDITERKTAETALQKSQVQLSEALDIAQLVPWEFDVARGMFIFNDSFYASLGTTAKQEGGYEMSAETYAQQYVHPDETAVVGENVGRAIQATDPNYTAEIDTRVVRTDGEVRNILVRLRVEKDAQGNTVKLIGANQDITERKQVEEEIRRLALVAQETLNAVIITNAEKQIEWVNPGFTRLTEYTLEEVVGQKPGAFLQGAETDQAAVQRLRTAIEKRESVTAELINYSKSGRKYWLEINLQPIFDDAGELIRFIAIESDVTERRAAADAIRQNEARLRDAEEVGNVGSWEYDMTADTLTWSDQAYRIYGLDRETFEVSFNNVVAHYPAGDREGVLEAFQQSIQNRTELMIEHRIITGSGEVRFVLERGRVTYAEDGTPLRMIGSVADITERKRAEEEVRASEERFRDVATSAIGWVWETDTQGRYTYCSEKTLELLGYTPEEMLGKTPFDFMLPSEVERIAPGFGELVQNKAAIVDLENWNRRKDGVEVCLLTNGVPMLDNEGNLLGFRGVDTDITERKRAEEEIRKRATELQTVAEVSTAATGTLDTATLLQNVADLTKERFGLYHAHIYLIDKAGDRLVLAAGAGEAGRQMLEQGWSIDAHSETSLVARAFRTRAGVIENDVQAAPDFLPNPLLPDTAAEMAVPLTVGERVLGVLDVQSARVGRFTEEDVAVKTTLSRQIATALENARLFEETQDAAEKLREVDRLKSEFLANMSHELRTPLNSIIGYTQLLLMDLEGQIDEASYEDLSSIDVNSKHLLNLINDILDLAKIEAGRMELNKEEVEIEYLLENLRGSTSGLFLNKPNLELVLEVEPDLPQIYADHVRVTQVLNNLVSNAVKFTDAGRVTVRAFRQADYIHIAVTDQGIGISEKDLETIFERFRQVDGSFTRRAEGTGLGLPITQHLVRMHGGELLVDSEFGVGSTFTVTFPIPTPSAEDEVATDAA